MNLEILSRGVLSIFYYVFLVILVILTFFVCAVSFSIEYLFDTSENRRFIYTTRIFRMAGLAAFKLNYPMWRVHVATTFPKIPANTIIICNHVSFADVMCLCLLPYDVKYLSKSTITNLPFVGWVMRMIGDIGVDRSDRNSGRQALTKCREWLDRDVSVMIFPEGTRSRDGQLQDFKDGAFKLAIDSGAPILPVAMTGTATAWAKNSWIIGPANVRLCVGDLIHRQVDEDVDSFKQRARQAIQTLIEQ